MKFLHTSDWHLGKRLGDFSRIEEQEKVLEEICGIAEEQAVDLVLVAGDIFDSFNPPSDAEELFYRSLKKLSGNGKRLVVVIAGNHDSADRIQAPEPLARESAIVMAGYPDTVIKPFRHASGIEIRAAEPGFIEVLLPGVDFPVKIIHTSYANELRLRKFLGNRKETALPELLAEKWNDIASRLLDDKSVNFFTAHLFFTGENEIVCESEDERSILHLGGASAIPVQMLPEGLHYAALGHIHGFHHLKGKNYPVVYCSSPLQFSLDDTHAKKYVVAGEAFPGKACTWEKIRLTAGYPIKRYHAQSPENALQWLHENPDCYVELIVETRDYLSAADRKAFLEAHPGILQIIPKLTGNIHNEFNTEEKDFTPRSRTELFIDYYQSVKGVPPGEKIMQLFNEIVTS